MGNCVNTETVRYYETPNLSDVERSYRPFWEVTYSWEDYDAHMNFSAIHQASEQQRSEYVDIEGHVKWDGCMNWNTVSCNHACGLDDALTIAKTLFNGVYEFAGTHLLHWDG